LIPGRGRKIGDRNYCQSYTGTMAGPFSGQTICEMLISEAALLLCAQLLRSSSVATAVFLNRCFIRPKHQSGEKLVCLAIRKWRLAGAFMKVVDMRYAKT